MTNEPRQPRGTPTAARRPLRHRNIVDPSRGRFGPTMTPMVDVVLVILIFFMASTTIAGHEWFLRAMIPEPKDALPQERDQLFVLPAPTIRAELFVRDGAVLVSGLGGREQTIEQSVTLIHALDESVRTEVVLLIVASDDTRFDDIMRLHDAAASIGMQVAIQ